MSFGSWLKRATRIRFDNRTLGNLLRNAAPVAGAFTGGAAGLALGGLGSAAGRAISPGSNIGDILKSGVSGASMAGLGMAAKKGLAGLMAGGADDAGGELAGGTLDDLANLPVPDVGVTPSGAPGIPPLGGGAPAASIPSVGTAAKVTTASKPGIFSRIGNFVEDHSTATAMGLKGLGDIASAPSENRFRDAQARRLDLQTQAEQDELERRRRLEASLEPIRLMLAQQLNAPRPAIPQNPYV